MFIGIRRSYAAKILESRCFLLFLSLLVLLLATPILSETKHGARLFGLLNILIFLTAIMSVERSRISIAIAIFLGTPALVFQLLALELGLSGHFALCWGFAAAFYAFTIAHLLHYVLRKDAMTADKLYGAVATYMMIAIFWSFVHGVTQYFYPGAYLYLGEPKDLTMAADLIYFSFTVITSTGFGDITPALIYSRYLTILESITGVMYVAILIARLTGVYPVIKPKSQGKP